MYRGNLLPYSGDSLSTLFPTGANFVQEGTPTSVSTSESTLPQHLWGEICATLDGVATQVTDPVGLLSMVGAGLTYKALRFGLRAGMSQLGMQGAGVRYGSNLLAFGGEASLFPVYSNLGNQAVGRQVDWSASTLKHQMASSFLFLGGLRAFGAGATSLFNQVHGVNPFSGLAARGVDHLATSRVVFQQAGMFSGIMAGHGGEVYAGLREPMSGQMFLADSMVTLLHFNAAGRILPVVTGRGFQRVEHDLEQASRRMDRATVSQKATGAGLDQLQPTVANALGLGNKSGDRAALSLSPGRNLPGLVMMASGNGTGGKKRRSFHSNHPTWDRGPRRVSERFEPEEPLEHLVNRLRRGEPRSGEELFYLAQQNPGEWINEAMEALVLVAVGAKGAGSILGVRVPESRKAALRILRRLVDEGHMQEQVHDYFNGYDLGLLMKDAASDWETFEILTRLQPYFDSLQSKYSGLSLDRFKSTADSTFPRLLEIHSAAQLGNASAQKIARALSVDEISELAQPHLENRLEEYVGLMLFRADQFRDQAAVESLQALDLTGREAQLSADNRELLEILQDGAS